MRKHPVSTSQSNRALQKVDQEATKQKVKKRMDDSTYRNRGFFIGIAQRFKKVLV